MIDEISGVFIECDRPQSPIVGEVAAQFPLVVTLRRGDATPENAENIKGFSKAFRGSVLSSGSHVVVGDCAVVAIDFPREDQRQEIMGLVDGNFSTAEFE